MTSGDPEAPNRHTRPSLTWLWVGLILLAAAVVGTAAGMWLGQRQGGPLTSESAAGGRPTIVVPTVSAAASVSSSPLPSATRGPTAVGQAPSTNAPGEYVVQPGDTLRSIAQQQYGDASEWPRIYQANQDVIGPDPDALQAGTHLKLP